MDLIQYLNENYFMLVPALWVLGYALKQTPFIPDWAIIWILFAASSSIAFYAFGINFEAIVNGLVAPGVAVFGHQLLKQSRELLNQNKKDE